MDAELFSNLVSEEDTPLEADVENDDFSSVGERCGICMDIVVDRGVLDCCQHWFCFVCIDNWATITNLCPLCQNEFQLITCVPVFDTISSNKTDDYSDLRGDDWCAEENNDTPSFPSYYIDENAVACLDGDGCKIRSGFVTSEEALTLDTSIACDSCDIWYHAFCVGFDTEGSGVDSWLCPRCLNEAEQKSEPREMHSAGGQLSLENGSDSLVDMSSGKVSITVADDGETALVISRIDGQDIAKGPVTNYQFNQDYNIHQKVEQSILDQGITVIKPKPTFSPVKLKDVKSEPFQGEPSAFLDLGFSFASIASEGDTDKSSLAGEECPCDPLDRKHVADENQDDARSELVPKLRDKRKRDENSVQMNDQDKQKIGLVTGSSTKKAKVQKRIRRTSLNDKEDGTTSNKFQRKKDGIRISVDQVGELEKAESIDIMSIVKGTESKTLNGPVHMQDNGECAKLQKNAARLRVKKILRRPSDEKESADVVQKLRHEIREAVRKKSVDDPGKSIVDPNLLAAFRAAVAEPAKRASPVDVKAKKLMLQKGKPRENLTKKIYATSNGKRRRAWDRDCEVEFWKHRCLTTSKTEKIATLKSVLNLLQKKPDTKVERDSVEGVEAPILSRLYLADTSLFPRKDDIKPLSVLRAATAPSHSDVVSSVEKDNKYLETNKLPAENNATSADDKNRKSTSNLKNGVTSGRLHAGGLSDKSSSLKKMAGKTDDVKIDKRKWALEVLARKTASNGSSPAHQKQDDEILRGNYPLLAELPSDLRPKLAPIRHNKVPALVRQAQLYRLTEVFLKMTNVSPIRRTAAVELAVADAINVEKQVADRSNSKVVYLNLCSQELRRHTNFSSSASAECAPSCPLPVPAEEEQVSALPHNSETEAVLRAAGLLSDSPPSSPLHEVEDVSGGASPSAEVKEEGIENILEMDSHPDLDIYGDFEYDLDEDYIGAPAVDSSKSQAEDGESKVKVVFSTLNFSGLDNASVAVEQVPSTSSMPGGLSDVVHTSSHSEDKKDSVPFPGDTSLDLEGEELSLAECEVLYGPDKEPLAKKLPELASADNLTSICNHNLDLRDSEKKNSTADCNHGATVGGSSPSCTQAVENDQEGKTNDLKVDKKIDRSDSVLKKVEAYVKEHLRPLCKSGVITVDHYRWAVGKTTDKVMKHHSKAKNANFLIKEGDKVKKLAAQYVEAAAKAQGK